jgi:hypothetical protein
VCCAGFKLFIFSTVKAGKYRERTAGGRRQACVRGLPRPDNGGHGQVASWQQVWPNFAPKYTDIVKHINSERKSRRAFVFAWSFTFRYFEILIRCFI